MKVDANLVPKECLSCCIRRLSPAMRNHEYILWRKLGVAKNKLTLAKERLRTQQYLSFARPSTKTGIEKRILIEELLQVHALRPHEMTMVRCSHTHSPKKNCKQDGVDPPPCTVSRRYQRELWIAHVGPNQNPPAHILDTTEGGRIPKKTERWPDRA